MTPERFHKVAEVFAAARRLPAADREGYLDEACGGDVDVRSEVASLLSTDDTGFLATPPAGRRLPLSDLLADDSARPRDASAGSPDPVRTMPAVERVGKYVVVARLDGGGQADVYRAVHPTLAQEVVVKVFRGGRAGRSDGTNEAAAEEGRVLAGLVHPNVARVLDSDVTADGRPFLVMEYVRGRTLRQHAGAAPLRPAEAARLVAQAARGLGAAHRAGVAHLDVKPHNLLVTDAGQVKVIDFGVARVRDAWREDLGDSVSGTLLYFAPEQALRRAADLGPRTDVFALGLVLYRLLAGRDAYAGGDPSTLPARAAAAAFDRGPLGGRAVPAPLRAACLRALSLDPADRYADGDAFAAALERAVRRRPRRALWVCTGAMVGAAAIGLALLARSRAPWPQPAPGPFLIDPPPHGALLQGRPMNNVAMVVDPAGLEGAGGWTVEPFGHRQTVTSAAYDRAGTWLATGSTDGTVRVWASRGGSAAGEERPSRVLICPGKVNSVSWSADGAMLAAGGEGRAGRPGEGPTGLTVWDPHAGGPHGHTARPLATATDIPNLVILSVAWSPARLRRLGLAAACADGTVRVWDVTKDGLSPRFAVGGGGGSHGIARSVSWSADGARLASTGADGRVRLWDSDSGKELTVMKEFGDGWAVAWSPDGGTLAAVGTDPERPGRPVVRLWNAKTLAENRPPLSCSGRMITSLAWSSDGGRLATAGGSDDRVVMVWDVGIRAGRPVLQPGEWAGCVAWSGQTGMLAWGSHGGAVGELSPTALNAGNPGNAVSAPGVLSRGGAAFTCFALSPDRRHIAVCRPDGQVWLWRVPSAPGERWQAASVLPGRPIRGAWLDWSADGTRLAAVGSGAQLLIAWDLSAANAAPDVLGEVPAVGQQIGRYVQWSPDGRSVVVVTNVNEVLRFELAPDDGPAFARPITLVGDLPRSPEKQVRVVASSPEGDRLAVGYSDGRVVVLTLAGPRAGAQPLWMQKAGQGAVYALAWSAEGRRLASGGAGAVIQIWEAGAGLLVGHASKARSFEGLTSLAWLPGATAVTLVTQSAVFTATEPPAPRGPTAAAWAVNDPLPLWPHESANFGWRTLTPDRRLVVAANRDDDDLSHVLTLVDVPAPGGGGTPAFRLRLAPMPDGEILAVGPGGNYDGTPGVLYVVESLDDRGRLVQDTLTPKAFTQRFGSHQNDASRVRLPPAEATRPKGTPPAAPTTASRPAGAGGRLPTP